MGRIHSTEVEGIDISQKIIRPKIRAYLGAKNAPPELIDAFNDGFCTALAALAVVGLYLQSEYPNGTNQQPVDDWGWLKNTLITLSRWDQDLASLNEKDRANIDRIISHLEFIQHISAYMSIGQGDLHQILEDTKGRKLQLEYTLAGLFNANDLTKPIAINNNGEMTTTTLITELLQYDRRMILISRGKHTLGLFKNGDEVSFFNAGNKGGIQTFHASDPGPLITAILSAYHTKPECYFPFGFKIFTYDKTPAVYKAQKHLLEAINGPHSAPAKNNSSRLHSAVYIAARIGCAESIRHYLNNHAEVDCISIGKRTPLYIAARRGHAAAVKALVANGADINRACRDGKTPLIHAAEMGHLQVLKCMIEYNNNIDDIATAINHLGSDALRKQFMEMITPVMTNPALLFSHPKIRNIESEPLPSPAIRTST